MLMSLLIGLIGVVVYVCLVGILTIRKIGLEGGAVFDLSNQLVGVTAPSGGIFTLIAIALLSVGVLGLLARRLFSVRDSAFRIWGLWGFGLGGIALGIFRMFWTGNAGAGDSLEQGFEPWVVGWIIEGIDNPAALTVVLASVVIAVHSHMRRRALKGAKGGDSGPVA